MGAEYGAINQNVQPNRPIIFLDGPCPCNQGLIFKKSGGIFLLASEAPAGNACSCGCGCRRIYSTDYPVSFHGNIQIPEGGTVEQISLAIAIDGVIDPESVMLYTPAAVEVPGNVGTGIIVAVPSLCGCENVAVVNTSTQEITVVNGVIKFAEPGVRRIY